MSITIEAQTTNGDEVKICFKSNLIFMEQVKENTTFIKYLDKGSIGEIYLVTDTMVECD